MNKMLKTLRAPVLPVVLAMLALTACQEVFPTARRQGATIVFGASTTLSGSVATKTEYSGEIISGTPGDPADYERINWLSSDRIRIWCDQATCLYSSDHFADYDIVPTSNAGRLSHADILPADDGNGLQWGAPGTYRFYALYPSETIGNGADVSLSTIESAAGGKAKICGRIPAEQTVTRVGMQFKPNMNLAYMYAATSETTSGSGSVSLAFQPLVTAFEFSFLNSSSDPLPAGKQLMSLVLRSESSPLSGDFEAVIGVGEEPAVTTAATGGSITVNFGSGVSLDMMQALTVTLFTLPVAQSDLTVELHLSDGTTRSIALKENDVWISVGARKKARFTNLGVPDKVWSYTLAPIGNITISGKRVLRQIDTPVRIHAYRNHPSPMLPAGWKAWYCDTDSDDPADWREDWASNWVDLSSYEGNGNYNTVSVRTQPAPVTGVSMYPGPSATAMINSLQANRRGGATAQDPLDLSTYDFLSNLAGRPAETANCYVLDGYGWFAIPLVYGNAVQNGSPTASPYTGVSAGINSPLPVFHNADGQAVGSSFILDDPNLDKSGNYSARVVWQSTDLTFEIIRDDDLQIIDAPAGAALSCKYLLFPIRREQAKPGNVLLALYDEGKEKILWSWHIWVTSENFTIIPTATDHPSLRMNFLSCHLGWTPPIVYTSGATQPRSQYVIIAKKSDNRKLGSFRVEQQAFTIPSFNQDHYSQPYYEWGRKDPLLPSQGYSQFHDLLNGPATSNYYDVYFEGGSITSSIGTGDRLGWSIRNPYIHLNANTCPYHGNLWNAKAADFSDSPVEKTIYDPCPRGFRVPRRSAFLGFQKPPLSEFNAWGVWVIAHGEMPPGMLLSTTNSNSHLTFYFPVSGLRGGYNSALTAPNTGYAWTASLAAPNEFNGNRGAMGLRFTGVSYLRTTAMPLGNGFPIRPSQN